MTDEVARDERVVSLRATRDGSTSRYLDARLKESGDLWIEGQDLGDFEDPIVAPDGEYEWVWEISADRFPELLRTLGADSDADVLVELGAHWSGEASFELERRLRESGLAKLTVL